jgi:hypothetical protein
MAPTVLSYGSVGDRPGGVPSARFGDAVLGAAPGAAGGLVPGSFGGVGSTGSAMPAALRKDSARCFSASRVGSDIRLDEVFVASPGAAGAVPSTRIAAMRCCSAT